MTKHITTRTRASAEDSTSIGIAAPAGILTGILAGFARTGAPLVDISSDPSYTHLAVRSCVPLNEGDVGRQVVMVPDVGNSNSLIVIGVIQPLTSQRTVEITADGKSVAVRADESITLRCGDASITLNRDGRVVIRGKHVVTHASGVNRIRGGSVELN